MTRVPDADRVALLYFPALASRGHDYFSRIH